VGPDDGPCAGRAGGHDGLVYGATFAPDGKTLATGGGDGTVRLWDVAARRELHVFRGHEEGVYAVAFFPEKA
jgi:WD40 repeat protein